MPDTCDSQWMCHAAAQGVNQDRVEFATFPALGLLNDILLVGTASTFGNYWNGGLGIYHLPVSLCKNSLLPKTIDLISERVSFTSFEASVASIAVLRRNDLKETTPIGVGLDDGSIQLIRMPSKIDEGMDRNSKLTLSINSATYHDWPIQRLVNSNGKLASLDVAGVVKTWDSEHFVPTSSWSIESYSWPQAGHSLEPDLAARPQPDPNHFSLATLSPCDPHRQLALWDSRLSTMRGPCLRWADKLADSFDLPRSICWLTSTLLALGTFNGFVHLYDIRFVEEARKPTVTCLSSLDAREWIGSPVPAHNREGKNQIIEMVTYPTGQPDLCQCVALIGLGNSVALLETDVHRMSFVQCYSTTRTACQSTGMRRGAGQFLPSEESASWQLLHSTGLPQLPYHQSSSADRTNALQLHRVARSSFTQICPNSLNPPCLSVPVRCLGSIDV